MKKIILTIILGSLLASTASAQNTGNSQFFELPKIPAELENIHDRTDYLIEHYWDFCDLDKAFSSRDKMAEAFDTYISLMPIATVNTVYSVVPAFMKKISKKPANVLFIGELAESKLYSDSATFPNDELFVLFANEIINNKKVDKNSKLRYQHLVQVLTGSCEGAIVPPFEYTDLLGNKGTFAVDTTRVGTILFINDPDCDNCSRARLRLDTDILTRRMIENGKIDLYNIFPADGDADWIEQSMNLPKEWHTVASEQVNELFDMRMMPMFYVINPNGVILLKTPDVNAIIRIMAELANVSATPTQPSDN